jgi:uncharacterized protein
LVVEYADPLRLWDLSVELSDVAHCAVDLLDLRAVSTVMQHQIVTTGKRLWSKDVQAGLFECIGYGPASRLQFTQMLLLHDAITGRA